jgi:pectate lyase
MRRAKLFLAAVVVAAIAAGTATAGAGKFELLGPDGNAFCDGSGVFAGAPGGFGFAVINASADGSVAATVSLKKQEPNTTYVVRLVQGVDDCYTVDAEVTTNAVGNATVHVSEPSVSSTALVAVDEGALASGGDTFVTETYNH